ncbi:MAG TPA: isochorismatase family protein [Xanthobacteraceae bacterium]|jgi:nicotinamidase-related amidase|nr:isochorismatase family protein [Xanthobacteraceae bacterium]
MFNHKVPGMKVDLPKTALAFTDLHNDFLAPTGKAYPLIEASLKKNNTAENIERLLRAAKSVGMHVFLSPHYYYPHDHRTTLPATPLEDLVKAVKLVDRKDALSLDGFEGSGADFPERYKPYLQDGKTVIASPHKGYSSSTNDMIFQMRRYGIEKIILAGPVGNLCVEGHMRDFIENGFQVAMVRDATAGAETEEGSGYDAAMINWRFLAHALWTTDEAVRLIEGAGK